MSDPELASSSALRPLVRPRLYEQVVERLLSHVLQAGLGPGDRLPSERDLAAHLGVSRASVRQAITVLQTQNIFEVRHGDGTYLKRLTLEDEPMARLIKRRRHLPEVLEARAALEVKIAELAAQRRTTQDLHHLDAALQDMEADIEAGGIGLDADATFHRGLALAAHNQILLGLMDSLSDDIAETRFESLSQPGRPPRSLAGHRRIAHAVEAREPARAAAAMQEHVELVSDVQLLHWDPEMPLEQEPDEV